MKSIDSKNYGISISQRLAVAAVLVAAMLASAHPISCDDFWWELSKGRAVAGGSFTPTADLIAAPTGSDANWLSGLAIYLVFSYLNMAGLMCLKVGVALAIAWKFLRRMCRFDMLSYAMVGTAILSARQAWEPSPLFFDTIGVIALATASMYWSQKPSVSRLILLVLLMCCWANLGPRCIVGIGIALPSVVCGATRTLIRTASVFLLVVACCLTPAGLMTLRDSLTITFPQTAEFSSILKLAGWHPWWEITAQAEAMAFALLSAAFLIHAARGPTVLLAIVFIATQGLACASSENLPLAAIWMVFVASLQTCPCDLPAVEELNRKHRRLQGIVYAALLGVALISAANPWIGCGSAFGWGLDPRIQPDAFAASIRTATLKENAHCVGIREAGLLSWHAVRGVKPIDTPITALLNGRLREHVLLTTDLSKGWQTPHRRPDGSWGGWWLVSKELKISAIVVPSEDLNLISSLEPSIWKPLSLNAVSLVYGKAGDPRCTQQIVNTLSLRQFVDRGTWTYQISSEESSDHLDVPAYFRGATPAYESLRLARVFRALDMNIAALKVLAVVPRGSNNALSLEFNANQLALGYDERIDGGRSSRFRMEAFRLTVAPNKFDEACVNVLNWPLAEAMQKDDMVTDAAHAYVDGDLNTAMERMPGELPELLYARSLLLLESGQVSDAKQLLEQLISSFPNHRLSATAQKIAGSLIL